MLPYLAVQLVCNQLSIRAFKKLVWWAMASRQAIKAFVMARAWFLRRAGSEKYGGSWAISTARPCVPG
jgi:hypothetical protein